MSIQIYTPSYIVTDIYLYKLTFSSEKESSCENQHHAGDTGA